MELMLEYYDLIEQLIQIGDLFDWVVVGRLNLYLAGNARLSISLILVLWEKLHWMLQLYVFMRKMGVIVVDDNTCFIWGLDGLSYCITNTCRECWNPVFVTCKSCQCDTSKCCQISFYGNLFPLSSLRRYLHNS
jgi:hypothetical protein